MKQISHVSLLLFILFFLVSEVALSQDINFNDYLNNTDIIILNEKTEISISGQKAYLIDVYVNKKVSYKINKAEGISRIENLELPEPFDKTFITHSPKIRQSATRLSGVKIKEFTSTVEKPDGRVITIQPDIRLISERTYTSGLGEAYYYNYHFNNLQEGDILTVYYSCLYSFKDNWEKSISTRIFFHSEFPILSCDFSFSHSSHLVVDTSMYLLAEPLVEEAGTVQKYSWHFDNLPGCLSEPGSRPYRELPHFIFSILPYELIYEEFNSYKQDFIPPWLLLSFKRESNIRPILIENSIGAKDKDNLTYNKIAEKFINEAGSDISGIKKIQCFQQWMADSVIYNDSKDIYDNQKNYLISRPSSDLYVGTIMDYAIESVYASMILKLGLNFYTAYPCDNRFGEMSNRYCMPMYNNDLMFATILQNNVVLMVMPRSEFNQYYCEELPFYYEDIPVILIHTNDFGGYKTNLRQTIRLMNTPKSELSDNYRLTKSELSFELSNSTGIFSTEIELSGQYSTLCRPSYFDKALDPTINPEYHHKIWETGSESKLISIQTNIKDVAYPYPANVIASYSIAGLIQENDDSFTVNLSNLIYHIGYPGFDSVFRFTDFYPDFVGTDKYYYQLVFDEPVELVQSPPNHVFNNEFVNYAFVLKQDSPTTIILQSAITWKKPVIPRQLVADVNLILKSIEKNKGLLITLKKK